MARAGRSRGAVRVGLAHLALSALVAAPAGCGDPAPAVHALFEVPRPGRPPADDFYALPFPSDLRVGDDGRIDLSDHVRPNSLIDMILETIAAEQRGFGLAAAGHFRFDGPLDPGSLPDGPEASLADDAAVYLIDVDPGSPDLGARIPVLTRFAAEPGETIGPNALGVLPYPGFVLAERRTYAFVATRRLRGVDGGPVEASSDFLTIASRDGRDDPSLDPQLDRAADLHAPLWAWLDRPGGDERDDVVAAAVFTTQAATPLLDRVRQVIRRDLPPPVARALELRSEALGMAWYDGRYDGPIFQRGEPPYLRPADGGGIELDADGEPVLQRLDDLRFSLTVPLGETPADGWPVAIYAHGTGGDYHSFREDGTAGRLAAAGIACVSIDQVLHGERAAGASPDVAFFNFQNPIAARDNTLQGAIDDLQVVRLLEAFDAEAGGRRLRFDPGRIYFFGHSQGSITGVPFVAHEPQVQAAVFSGAGGLLYLSLLHKTEPIDIAGLLAVFLRDDPLDEFNPILALLQTFMEPADAAAHAHLLVTAPPDDRPARDVFVSEGLTDRYTPIVSIEALATATGVDLAGPVRREVPGLALAGHAPRALPVSDNRAGATAVLLQYDEAAGSDGHFVLFDVPDARRQSVEFLASHARTGTATVPP